MCKGIRDRRQWFLDAEASGIGGNRDRRQQGQEAVASGCRGSGFWMQKTLVTFLEQKDHCL